MEQSSSVLSVSTRTTSINKENICSINFNYLACVITFQEWIDTVHIMLIRKIYKFLSTHSHFHVIKAFFSHYSILYKYRINITKKIS